ncbi:hypothetical protein DFH08DRAFT_1025594 [Mycena albidolilacea]|uniref:Uncharacterized protein n=1 Tax=Mycena albidolilacea TaxID=1033008 RepID=A0AAD7F1I5_9AGAR|nr:hypothetical protein DFH08DRAFT_1025594 [Mycena albidolilacea]
MESGSADSTEENTDIDGVVQVCRVRGMGSNTEVLGAACVRITSRRVASQGGEEGCRRSRSRHRTKGEARVERKGDVHVEGIVHTCSEEVYVMEGDTETLEVTSAGSAGRRRGAVRRSWWTCVVRAERTRVRRESKGKVRKDVSNGLWVG